MNNINEKKAKNNCQTWVYFSCVRTIKSENFLDNLPKERIDKFKSLIFEKDQKLSIGSWLLLQKAMKKHHININEHEICYGEKGKPYLKDSPLDFNLSHSGDYVLVAISNEEVGVDIQEIKEIDSKLIEFVCSKEEINQINMSKDRLNSFFDIWTLKESYLKQTGKGLVSNLKNIDAKSIIKDKNLKSFSFDKIKNYKVNICCKSEMLKIIKEIKL